MNHGYLYIAKKAAGRMYRKQRVPPLTTQSPRRHICCRPWEQASAGTARKSAAQEKAAAVVAAAQQRRAATTCREPRGCGAATGRSWARGAARRRRLLSPGCRRAGRRAGCRQVVLNKGGIMKLKRVRAEKISSNFFLIPT